MLKFIEHTVFQKEYLNFSNKYYSNSDLQHLKNVLNFQFNPINPKLIIGPGKIHRVKVCENCEIWKVEMSVKGLRKNQSPRIWLAVAGDTLAFLTIKTHIDNYDDNEVNRFAENLSTDIF